MALKSFIIPAIASARCTLCGEEATKFYPGNICHPCMSADGNLIDREYHCDDCGAEMHALDVVCGKCFWD